MNKEANLLDLFFEEKIYDLDDDEIGYYLSNYPDEEINASLNKKLKSLTPSDEPWNFGVTFKSVKKSTADKFILPKIYDAKDNIKEAYFEFLCGFWEKIDINQLPFIKEYSNYLVKLLSNLDFNEKLLHIAVRTFATAYLYNKSVCEKELDIYNNFEIVKKYAQTSMVDCSLKDFILE